MINLCLNLQLLYKNAKTNTIEEDFNKVNAHGRVRHLKLKVTNKIEIPMEIQACHLQRLRS